MITKKLNDQFDRNLMLKTSDDPWIADNYPKVGQIARAHIKARVDVEAIEKYSHQELLPRCTILECIKSAAQADETKTAIIHLGCSDGDFQPEIITYKHLVDSIERSANLFANISGAKQPVVAVILPSLPDYLYAMWGAATVGVCVPINPFLEKKLVYAILNKVKATVLVTCMGEFGAGIWNDLADVMESVASLKKVFIAGSYDYELSFSKALEDSKHLESGQYKGAADDEAIYMPTGGTTGDPKLVKMSHWSQLVIGWNVGALMGADIKAVVAHGMPNFHCGGAITICLKTIIYGQTLVTLTPDGFRNKGIVNNFWKISRAFNITSVLATPTTASALLEKDSPNFEGQSITDFFCGGSTIPLELIRRFHEKFNVWLRENWGMTEICGTTNGQPSNGVEPIVGSVGLMLPHCRTKAVEVDKSNRVIRECAPGERGTLILEGPSQMIGYLAAGQDEQYFVKGMADEGTWGNTGDIGSVDKDGYVWVYGREKDLIVRGGHNIDAKLIEEVLVQHPSVQLAAAVGRPDRLKGEMPIAYVTLVASANSLTSSDELKRFCREHIMERAAVPVDIIIMDEMPLTPVGKIFKPKLRKNAIVNVARHTVSELIYDTAKVKIFIDESGARPIVKIHVDNISKNRELEQQLEKAFEGFEFITEILIA